MALVLSACVGEPSRESSTTTLPPVSTSSTESPTATTLNATSTVPTPSTSVPETGLVEITIAGGEVVGGPAQLEVDVGSEVSLLVTSDQPGHVHVHGYDLFFELVPGLGTEVRFTADAPGVFEIEVEGTGTLIVELTVN
ncbi:MAG: hypothetical protein WD269_02100 [Acidimicrobiia bacterium]